MLLCADCTEMAAELVYTRWTAVLSGEPDPGGVVNVRPPAERYHEAKKAYMASGLLADKLAMEAAMEDMPDDGLDRITDANMDHYVPAPPPGKRTFNGVLVAVNLIIGVLDLTVLQAAWWVSLMLVPGFLINMAAWRRWWIFR